MGTPRIGLVLGGGGVIGNAYLTGVLEGIRRVSGWDPGGAHVTVGTSAGSVNGALSALGMPCDLMYRYVCGDPISAEERAALPEAARRFQDHPDREWTDRLFPPSGVFPRPLLSSPRAVARGLLRPWTTSLELFVTGLVGEGFVSTRTIGELIELVCPSGWPQRGPRAPGGYASFPKRAMRPSRRVATLRGARPVRPSARRLPSPGT